ncbi:porin family protein [candidate division KSB1 bacterium]
MKKSIIVFSTALILLLLFSLTATAQDLTIKERLRERGLKAGLNYTSFYNQIFGHKNPKIGFLAGGYLSYFLKNNIFFQPELFFAMKGLHLQSFAQLTNERNEVIWDINYIEMPLLLKFFTKGRGDLDYEISFGPTIAYKINSSEVVKVTYNNPSGSITESTEYSSDRIKKFDYGFLLSMGFKFKIKSKNVLIEPRVVYGLSNVFESKTNQTGKNIAWSLLFGIWK